jgi:hypothetical protein
MKTFLVASLALLGVACDAAVEDEVVWVGRHAVAVRACKLYDEPTPACRGAPEGTAPLVDEPGAPAERWLLVPKGGLLLASGRMVKVRNRWWYEVVLPADVRGYVPASIAESIPEAVIAQPRRFPRSDD